MKKYLICNFLIVISIIIPACSFAQDSLNMHVVYSRRNDNVFVGENPPAFSVGVRNHTLYTTSLCTVQTFDITNPAQPVRLRDIQTNARDVICNLRFENEEMLVANYFFGGGGVYQLVERDLANYLGCVSALRHSAVDFIKVGSCYYSFCGYHGFEVFNLSDIANPHLVMQDTLQMNRRAELVRDYLFTIASTSLRCYDVSVDSQPVFLYEQSNFQLQDIAVSGNRIACAGNDTISIYSVGVNGALTLDAQVPLTDTYDILFVGDLLFAVTTQQWVEVWQVESDEPAQRLGFYRYPPISHSYTDYGHIAVDGNTIFLRTWARRFNFDFSEAVSAIRDTKPKLPLSSALLSVYPNPFNSSISCRFFLPKAGSGVIDVTDVTGRSVATLSQGTFVPGINQVQWNAAGLSSGNYFVRLRTRNEAVTRPITLLK